MKSHRYSTLSSYGVAVAQALASYDLASEVLFLQSGLDPEVMKNPNARYPDDALLRLLRAAVEASGDEAFGLRLARCTAPTTLHALGFSLLASETLLAALQRLVRYYRIVADGVTFNLEQDRREYHCIVSFATGADPVRVDALAALLVDLGRRLIGPGFVPRAIELERVHPDRPQAHAERLGVAPTFGAEGTRLVLERAEIEAVLPTGNAELAYQNDKIVADYLARFDAARLSERVRAIFTERLVTGKFSEEQIADQLNLSLRSLQRRLREEQTSYQQLLDETRLELALQYINRTRLSVAQIAPLLGFSDSSNFNRAFKRWLGISPSRYRALEAE